MTVAEFKAWFAGYTEGFCGKPPSSEQWARIEEEVKRLLAEPSKLHQYQPYQIPAGIRYGYTTPQAGNITMIDGVKVRGAA